MARVRTQVRRHRYAMELRESVNNTMALAVTDALTGLYNRRYFDRHLNVLLGKAQELIVFIESEQPIPRIAARLEKGEGEVSIVCLLPGREATVKLPGQYRVTPQIRGAIRAVPGVVEVHAR